MEIELTEILVTTCDGELLASIPTAVEGVVSNETKLSTLSIVDDVQKEIKRMEEENAIEPVYDFQVGETS